MNRGKIGKRERARNQTKLKYSQYYNTYLYQLFSSNQLCCSFSLQTNSNNVSLFQVKFWVISITSIAMLLLSILLHIFFWDWLLNTEVLLCDCCGVQQALRTEWPCCMWGLLVLGRALRYSWKAWGVSINTWLSSPPLAFITWKIRPYTIELRWVWIIISNQYVISLSLKTLLYLHVYKLNFWN